MATPARSSSYSAIGAVAGPEETVLVGATNIDVDANIEFAVIGDTQAIELSIVSGTAKSGSPSVVFSVEAYDAASGTWESLVTSAALTDAGSTYLVVGRDVVAVANKAVQRLVRPRMRLKIDYTGTPVTDVLNNTTVTLRAD